MSWASPPALRAHGSPSSPATCSWTSKTELGASGSSSAIGTASSPPPSTPSSSATAQPSSRLRRRAPGQTRSRNDGYAQPVPNAPTASSSPANDTSVPSSPRTPSTTTPGEPTCDLFEVRALTGARLYVFAVIEHTTRRIRILGVTAHPTGYWIVQLGRNLLMDLEDAGSRARFLIRDRDSKFTAAFDPLMTDAGLKVVTTGIRIPRMNSLMERWIQTCRSELLDRTLIWNQGHLLNALRGYESFYNEHRPHRALEQAAPCRPLPAPHHATSPACPPGRPQTRPTRRNPPRVPASGLNCADDLDDLSAPTMRGRRALTSSDGRIVGHRCPTPVGRGGVGGAGWGRGAVVTIPLLCYSVIT